MSCLIFLCDDAKAARAAGMAARNCDAVDHVVLNWVQDRSARTPMAARPSHEVAVLQVWTSELHVKVAVDAAARLGMDRFYTVAREIFLPPKVSPGIVKRMSLLERADNLSPVQFRTVWKQLHGPRVASRTGALLGYCQNHVLACSPSAPPCDGLTELWFPDLAAMEAVLPPTPSSPEALTSQASTFISRISTLLMEEVCLK